MTLQCEGKQGAGDQCAERTLGQEYRIAIVLRMRLKQGPLLQLVRTLVSSDSLAAASGSSAVTRHLQQ